MVDFGSYDVVKQGQVAEISVRTAFFLPYIQVGAVNPRRTLVIYFENKNAPNFIKKIFLIIHLWQKKNFTILKFEFYKKNVIKETYVSDLLLRKREVVY